MRLPSWSKTLWHVGASFGRRGGGTSLEHLTTQGLQLRLHRNIVADLRQQGADDVPDFIVADGWETPKGIILETTLLTKHNGETTNKRRVEEGKEECMQKRNESRRKKRR